MKSLRYLTVFYFLCEIFYKNIFELKLIDLSIVLYILFQTFHFLLWFYLLPLLLIKFSFGSFTFDRVLLILTLMLFKLIIGIPFALTSSSSEFSPRCFSTFVIASASVWMRPSNLFWIYTIFTFVILNLRINVQKYDIFNWPWRNLQHT